MGAADFHQIAYGKTPEDAFKQAHDEATYEHGHGGYSGSMAEKGNFFMVTRTPMTLAEADAKAQQLFSDYESDDPIAQQVNDKWGPAACIPVILPTRKVQVSGFDYTANGTDEALKEAVADKVKLKKGESIAQVRLTNYHEPTLARPSSFNMGRRTSWVRTDCSAEVTINKPPVTREVTFKTTLEIPADQQRTHLDFDVRQKRFMAEARLAVKLKPGEKIVSVREGASTASKAKVTATVPKEKAVTRYIIENSHRHGAWKTGFKSQAEARAWATEQAGRSTGDGLIAPQDIEVYNILGVTRRESGAALVTVERRASNRTFEVTAVVAREVTGQPDAYLFFGFASS